MVALEPFAEAILLVFFMVNPEGRKNSFPVEVLMNCLLVTSRKPRPTGPFENFLSDSDVHKGCSFTVTQIFIVLKKIFLDSGPLIETKKIFFGG